MSRNAYLFVVISLLSGFGGGVLALVAGVWILDLTGSAGVAALAGLCVYAPQLAGPWLGSVLDRVPRRRLVIAANLARAGGMLGLLAVRTADDSWLIFAVVLVHGVGYVLEDAGETALLPAAVPTERLATVNGWRSSALEGTKLVAPAAGAGLYAWRGGAAVAALTASLAMVNVVLYAALRLAPTPARSSRPPKRALRTALAVLTGQPELRATVGLATVAIAMSGFQIAAVYAVVTRGLGLPATFLGVLLSAQGGGSILGGLVAGRLIRRRGPLVIACAGATLFATGCLVRCLPWWPTMVCAAVISGIGLPWTLVAALTAVQLHTPPALLGRVAGTASTVMFGPLALAIPLGSAAVHLGSRLSLVTAAAACLAAVAVYQPRRVRSTVRTPGTGATDLDERAWQPSRPQVCPRCRGVRWRPVNRADEEQFRVFVTTRSTALLSFAYVLTGDRRDAEDLVQGALASTALAWRRLHRKDDPEGYVRRSIVRGHLNVMRRRPWRERPTAELPELPDRRPGESVVDDRDAMWQLLATLPPRQRAVLVLRYYEDLSEADIADVLGCSRGTVKSQSARALARLRDVFTTQETPS